MSLLVSTQRCLLSVPAWVLPGASVDLDFAGGRYYLPGGGSKSMIACTRASSGLAQRLDGSWVMFGANEPRITDQGLLCEDARTNLFLNSAAPVTQNVTLATGSVVVTVWGASGSVTTAAGTATGTGFGAISASVAGTRQILAISVAGTITCTVSGSPLYVQVEAGAFGTSPILTTGATATRATDLNVLTGGALAASLRAKSIFAQVGVSAGLSSNVGRLVDYNGGQTARAVSPNLASCSSGANEASATLGAGTWTTAPVKASFGLDADGMTAKANGGALATNGNAPASLVAPVTIGNYATGTRAYGGYVARVAFSQAKSNFDGRAA